MMRISLITILFFLVVSANASADNYALLEVEDGDTLVVKIAQQPTRVQLAGIDAPEDVGNPKLLRDVQRTGKSERELLKLGTAATAHLRSLLPRGAPLVLEGDLNHKDKYGRIPVVAKTPAGVSLNAAMVRDGYAIAMRGAVTAGDLRDLEVQAIAQSSGLWKLEGELMRAWSGTQNNR